MQRTNWITSIALSLLFVTSVTAQVIYEPPLVVSEGEKSVQELIDLALENQASYRKTVQDRDLAIYSVRGAWGQFLPRLTAGYGAQNYKSSQAIVVGGTVTEFRDQWSSSSSYDLTATLDLFTGFRRIHDMKKAALQKENAWLSLESSENTLIFDVKTAVYNYRSTIRALEVAKEVLLQRQQNLDYARARFESGDVIELDVLQAEIDVNTQENTVLEREQDVENAREALNLTLGIHLDSRFPVKGQLDPAELSFQPDNLVKTAMQTRPDYLQTRNNIQYYKSDIQSKNADYYPSLSIGGQYSASENKDGSFNFVIDPENDRQTIWMSLDWTLFNQFQREISRQQAVVNRRKAQWDQVQLEQQIDANVRKNQRNLERLYQQIQVTDQNRTLARRQLDLEQERYRLGASSQLNLRQAQVTFIQAENEHIAKVLEYYTTLAALELDVGKPLEEVGQ
ncbi:hypothetical protein GF324_02940 [bacterium]|nr:hypothetical protein [bacterium]